MINVRLSLPSPWGSSKLMQNRLSFNASLLRSKNKQTKRWFLPKWTHFWLHLFETAAHKPSQSPLKSGKITIKETNRCATQRSINNYYATPTTYGLLLFTVTEVLQDSVRCCVNHWAWTDLISLKTQLSVSGFWLASMLKSCKQNRPAEDVLSRKGDSVKAKEKIQGIDIRKDEWME